MVQVRVDRVPEKPGYARIVVPRVAAPTGTLGIIIRREGYQEANLGVRGWQVREEELLPAEVSDLGNDIGLLVGPRVTHHLEPAPYFIEIRSLRIQGHVFWPDGIDFFDGELPPDPAFRHEPEAAPSHPRQPPSIRSEQDVTRVVSEKRLHPSPAPQEVKPPEPPVPPKPVDPAPVKPRRLAYVISAAALLLVLAGVAAWFAFPELRPGRTEEALRPPQAPQQLQPQPPTPSPTPTPAPSPSPTPAWPDGTDDWTPAEVVPRAPSSEAILSVAQRRLQQGKYEDALVLFEQAAERGSGPASTALARMYDPNGFQPGKPFKSPDGRTAAGYYKEALTRGDTNAAAPREALRQRLEKEAREGSTSAATALKDYWP